MAWPGGLHELDLLVAAVALQHNAVLVSFDADFEAIVMDCHVLDRAA